MSLGVMEEYIDRLDWEIWANRGVVLDLLRSIVFDRQGLQPFLCTALMLSKPNE